MIKNDYNKKLRIVCEKVHGGSIKERADTAQVKDGKASTGVTRHFAFNEDFVRIVNKCDDTSTVVIKEIEKLKEDNRRLKEEVASLRQDRSDKFSDFVFDEMDDFTVSVVILLLLLIISSYLMFFLN